MIKQKINRSFIYLLIFTFSCLAFASQDCLAPVSGILKEFQKNKTESRISKQIKELFKESTSPFMQFLYNHCYPSDTLEQWVVSNRAFLPGFETDTARFIQLKNFSKAFEKYDAGRIFNMQILRYSEEENGIKVLLVEAEKGSFVIKRYPDRLEEKDLDKLRPINSRFAERFCPYEIPTEILSSSGKPEVDVQTQSYVVYPQKGKSLRFSSLPLERLSSVLAGVLAQVHSSLEGLSISDKTVSGNYQIPLRDPSRCKATFSQILAQIRNLPEDFQTNARKLILSEDFSAQVDAEIRQLAKDLPEALYQSLPKSACHGDFHKGNILMNDQGLPSEILDWDDSRMESRLLDLSRAFFSILSEFELRLKRPSTSKEFNTALNSFLENYTLSFSGDRSWTSEEIKALPGYLRADVLYEIFYRGILLTREKKEDYFNSETGDKRFHSELSRFLKLFSCLKAMPSSSQLEETLGNAQKASGIMEEIFKNLTDQGRDPLLVAQDEVLEIAKKSSGLPLRLLEKAHLAKMDLLLARAGQEAKTLEKEADQILKNQPRNALTVYRKALNLLERVSAGCGFEDASLKEFARLSRKIEALSFTHPSLSRPERKNQIILVPTQNRSESLKELLGSIEEELSLFEFGKYDSGHKMLFIILEDSTDPQESLRDKETIDLFQKKLALLSPRYELQYWSSEKQEEEINRINREVFQDKWDLRSMLYPQKEGRLELKKSFSRIRNLGLIAARSFSEGFDKPEQTLVTWMDDDARLGTTVIHRNKTREAGVHAFNYFQKTQSAFQDFHLGYLLGGDTHDSSNALVHLSCFTDLLKTLENAENTAPEKAFESDPLPFRILSRQIKGAENFPWVMDSSEEAPLDSSDYLCQTLKALSEFQYGRNPLRTISYLPESSAQTEDYELLMNASRRMGSGNNVSFLMDAASEMAPYMTGISRGEDLFKNIQDAGLLKKGYGFANTSFNAIDNLRLPGTRENLLDEIEKHLLGITPVQAYALLIENLLRQKDPGHFSEKEKVFLTLDHLSALHPEWLSELKNPEQFLSFDDWKKAADSNYQYIREVIEKAHRAAKQILQKGFLSDAENSRYYWLKDTRFKESLAVLIPLVNRFADEKIFETLEKTHAVLSKPDNEYYRSFLQEVKRYTQNFQNWKQFWNQKSIHNPKIKESMIREDVFKKIRDADTVFFLEENYNASVSFMKTFFIIGGIFLGGILGFLFFQSLPAVLLLSVMGGMVLGGSYALLNPKTNYSDLKGSFEFLKKSRNMDDLVEAQNRFASAIKNSDSLLMRNQAVTGVEITKECISRLSPGFGFRKESVYASEGYKTAHGRPYHSLFKIQEGSLEERALGLEYSYLKFGRKRELDGFADLLTQTILSEHGDDIRKNPDQWIVVNPAGTGIPNAAVLMASRVSEALNLPHVSVSPPLASRRSLQTRLQSKTRSQNWSMEYVEKRSASAKEPVLEGKKILFIDDGVLTGTILENVCDYAENLKASKVEPYVLVNMEPEKSSNLEKEIDTQILKRFGIDPLMEILNDPDSVYTTRVLNYSFQLPPESFQELVSSLNPEAAFNLYLCSLEYLRDKASLHTDVLVKRLESMTGFSFPKSDILSTLTREDFYLNIIEILKKYNFHVPLKEAGAVSFSLWEGIEKVIPRKETKLVLFDLDKTLVSSPEYYAQIRSASEEFLSGYLSLTIQEVREKISFLKKQLELKNEPLRQRAIAEEFGIVPEMLDQEISKRLNLERILRPDDQWIHLLQELKKEGKKLAVVTDSPEGQTGLILEALGLASFFDLVVTPEISHAQKPSLIPFVTAMKFFHANPEETVMIGDQLNMDILPSRVIGIKPLQIQKKSDLNLLPLSLCGAKASSFFQDQELLKKLTDELYALRTESLDFVAFLEKAQIWWANQKDFSDRTDLKEILTPYLLSLAGGLWDNARPLRRFIPSRDAFQKAA